jgi:hypothetical protein
MTLSPFTQTLTARLCGIPDAQRDSAIVAGKPNDSAHKTCSLFWIPMLKPGLSGYWRPKEVGSIFSTKQDVDAYP